MNEMLCVYRGENMKITDAKEFGKAIRDRRKELNYTQGYISEITGYSISFISNLEGGKATAELGKAIDLAMILGLDIFAESREGDR